MAKANASSRQKVLPKQEDQQLHLMPVFSCRHRALKASVWRNESDNGPFFNVTVTRSYKNGDTWKDSSSFGYDDILHVAELLRTCHSFISREIVKERAAAKADAKPSA
jgi:hypothetical protein